MKTGNQVLQDLKKQVSADQFEDLLDDIADTNAQHEREIELFGEVLNMEEIDDELAAMVAQEDAANMEAIPDAGVGYVAPVQAPAANVPVADPLDAAMEEEEEAPARQLVAA